MKTPREIYAAYTIMPSLQMHQLRVAAVAQLVCKNFSSEGGSASGGQKPINERDVVLACLFHDMGNIIKSELSYFPDFTKPEGVEYWERVKADGIKKYGNDAHSANVSIAKEIGLPETILGLLDAVGYSRIEGVVGSSSFELKLCQYADTRVGPRGILPQDERLAEGRERYVGRKKNYYDTDDGFKRLSDFAHELERQIFAHMSIRPEDISDVSVGPLIEKLWEYPIEP